MLCVSFQFFAQDIALKTNVLGWATTSPNIGAEFGIGRKSTVQIFGSINPWEFGDDKHFRMWNVMPEYRYWLCEKFGGHFVGVHLLGGQYNAKNMNFPLKCFIIGSNIHNDSGDPASAEKGWPNLTSDLNAGRHAEGWYGGVGISYGYQWMLSRHWNIEASLGIGYAYSGMTLYGRCNRIIDKRNLHYFGLTRAAASIMYLF